MATIEARVRRGAALLDERVPGWMERINLERLRLEDCRACVLGQLYGGFGAGLRALDLHWPDPETLGFCKAGRPTDSNYLRLTAAWRALISERRASDAH
jgi:hypothetical protein